MITNIKFNFMTDEGTLVTLRLVVLALKRAFSKTESEAVTLIEEYYQKYKDNIFLLEGESEAGEDWWWWVHHDGPYISAFRIMHSTNSTRSEFLGWRTKGFDIRVDSEFMRYYYDIITNGAAYPEV